MPSHSDPFEKCQYIMETQHGLSAEGIPLLRRTPCTNLAGYTFRGVKPGIRCCLSHLKDLHFIHQKEKGVK